MSWVDYDELRSRAELDGRTCLAGALILDRADRVFVQRRAWDRKLLPGCWDIVGGHVEHGESILEALRREIREETGWELDGEPRLARVTDWEAGSKRYREFDFLVDVAGDLDNPKLDSTEHVEFRWIGEDELALLDENADADQGMVAALVKLALRSCFEGRFAFPHLTIFFPARTVERERVRWDPAMAAQIAAHLTVVYPAEIESFEDLLDELAERCSRLSPFRLRLGKATSGGRPEDGVFVTVDDLDGGWSDLRSKLVRPELAVEVEPHVTLVHPRTSNRGREAWDSLELRSYEDEIRVQSIAATAFDGRDWVVVREFPLAL